MDILDLEDFIYNNVMCFKWEDLNIMNIFFFGKCDGVIYLNVLIVNLVLIKVFVFKLKR